jgi:toxin-antitoxin system PIN domain toxin
MILPDVNVLIYAFRRDSPNHRQYKQWLEDVVNGDAAYGISPQALASLARIATHPGIFAQPSTLDEALSFSRALLTRAHATVISPGERHWEVFDGLCRATKATGNLVQDAWYAALAIEAGCEWVSTDGDYARFKGLRWQRPF